jgi:hypothetical protein
MRARPAGPAQSSVLHNFARSGPTKEAHRRALNRSDGLLRSEAGQVRLRRDPTQGMTACRRHAVSTARYTPDLRFWSPRSDSNRRPSDYESKRLRPACAAQTRSGCSRQQARPASAFLTGQVTAGGMTRPTRASTMATFRSGSEAQLPSGSPAAAVARSRHGSSARGRLRPGRCPVDLIAALVAITRRMPLILLDPA